LRVALKDYKNEVEDILVGDKQLAKEILFDMKQLEQEKVEAAAAARAEAALQEAPVVFLTSQGDFRLPSRLAGAAAVCRGLQGAKFAAGKL
jgi:condensin-2 complex subunit D3